MMCLEMGSRLDRLRLTLPVWCRTSCEKRDTSGAGLARSSDHHEAPTVRTATNVCCDTIITAPLSTTASASAITTSLLVLSPPWFAWHLLCCLALVVLPGLVWAILTPLTGRETSNEEGISGVLIGVIVGVACLAGLALLALLIFLGYHLFLIASGKTTKEHLGKSRPANIVEEPTLWAARGPRLFDPRVFVQI